MRRTTIPISPRPLALSALLALAAVLALAAPATAQDHGSDSGFGDDPAGKIASFDSASGVLVIDLADGGSISGLVTRFTFIETDDDEPSCDRARGDRHRRQLHGDWCRPQLHGLEHDDSGNHHGWRHSSRGSTDDLVPGATVEDAFLILKDGRAFYAKVALGD